MIVLDEGFIYAGLCIPKKNNADISIFKALIGETRSVPS
jgi:hypothetical protein